MVKEVNKNAVFYQLLSEVDKHDIAAYDVINVARKRNLLKEYRVAFMCNNSLEPMVLPTGGIVQYYGYLICPVTPWRAIVFDRNAEPEEEDKRIIKLYEIAFAEEIKELNVLAFEQESKHDRKYIIASSRKQLENLREETDKWTIIN